MWNHLNCKSQATQPQQQPASMRRGWTTLPQIRLPSGSEYKSILRKNGNGCIHGKAPSQVPGLTFVRKSWSQKVVLHKQLICAICCPAFLACTSIFLVYVLVLTDSLFFLLSQFRLFLPSPILGPSNIHCCQTKKGKKQEHKEKHEQP